MKNLLFIMLSIIGISITIFSVPVLNPSSDIIDEGAVQILAISNGNIGIRYGLFGFIEVGASENEGAGYLKLGTKNLLNIPLQLSASYGYGYDGSGYIINGVLGIDMKSLYFSGGIMFSKSQSYDYEKNDFIDLYELNPFATLVVKIDEISTFNMETNFPVYSSNISASGISPSISIYATQKYDNVFFYKYVGIYGGVKYDFKVVKILFGVSGEISFFTNKNK